MSKVRLLALWVLFVTLPVELVAGRAEDCRLVVVIAIDQCRADYLERFAPVFKAGLKRLLARGVLFTDAHHEHAMTSTGPGHAALSTGAYPSRTGIVGNQWFENDGKTSVNCVTDLSVSVLGPDGSKLASEGRSPRNLRVPGLTEWLKARYPKARSFAASRKDRGAILLGGQGADWAFWYDPDSGGFISSTYYDSELPAWVRDFNASKLPDKFFGRLWEPLSPLAPDLLKQLEIEETGYGWFRGGFPHAIGGPSLRPAADFYSSFGGTPFMDDYLLQFVKGLIQAERLGRSAHPDLLGVSLSALDSIGHSYGPNSPEILDAMRRIDLALGDFLDFLDAEVGLERTVIALTADHGAMPLPEYLRSRGGEGERLNDKDTRCLQQAGSQLSKAYPAESNWFVNGFYLDYAALGRHNLKREAVERDFAAILEQCPFVRKVWTRSELEDPREATDHFERLFRNNFFAGRSPDLMIQVEEYFLESAGTGTSHGTPYPYDTHVPILLMVPEVSPKRIDDRVATVDLAPTLAALLGLEVPSSIDGRDLTSILP